LPCESASDCGAGFTCEEQQQCGCSSSAGRPGAGDGDSSEPVPADSEAGGGSDSDPDCTCTPTGEFACRVVITACSSDDECESGWTCIDNPEGVCSSDSEGNADCEQADPARLCAPPHYDLVGAGRGISKGDSESGDPTSSPDNAGSEDDSADADSEERTSGGCAMTTSRSPNVLALLFAGVAALLAGRRKKLCA
jgi:hypothetical protein